MHKPTIWWDPSPTGRSDFVTTDQYRIYRKYSDWQAWTNSEDTDQIPQNAASDLGLHCLLLIQQTPLQVVIMGLLKF